MTADIETVRELGTRHSNRGRWGPDEKGTLNLVTLEMVVAAAALVRVPSPGQWDPPLNPMTIK